MRNCLVCGILIVDTQKRLLTEASLLFARSVEMALEMENTSGH